MTILVPTFQYLNLWPGCMKFLNIETGLDRHLQMSKIQFIFIIWLHWLHTRAWNPEQGPMKFTIYKEGFMNNIIMHLMNSQIVEKIWYDINIF